MQYEIHKNASKKIVNAHVHNNISKSISEYFPIHFLPIHISPFCLKQELQKIRYNSSTPKLLKAYWFSLSSTEFCSRLDTIRVSNVLHPDLGPNCLQRLSVVDKGRLKNYQGYYSKTGLKRPLKSRQLKDLNDNGSLLKVKSIAECSPWSIMQYL